MKASPIEIKEKVDALLICLDKDVQHLQKGISRLHEMRRWIIKRDDTALSRLLEEIRTETDAYGRHERNRQSIRQELAEALGYDLKQTTLSTLETILPKVQKDQIKEKKIKLKTLIEEFRKEHFGTAMLLSECARFNNTLLKSIFDPGKVDSLSYNSNGAAKRHTDVALINLQL